MTARPAQGSGSAFLSALRRRLDHNLGLRVVSLLIAAGLWVFVNAGERNAIKSLNVPIEYVRLPPGLALVNQPSRFVKIQVAGPRNLLSLLNPRRLAAKLDLSGIGAGRSSFKIDPAMFGAPRRTLVISVSPSEVSLEVDRVIKREVPVHVDLQGSAGAGYQIAGVQVVPAVVIATGPRRFVTALKKVDTMAVDVLGATRDVERRIGLMRPGHAVVLSAAVADVKVSVKEKASSHELRPPAGSGSAEVGKHG